MADTEQTIDQKYMDKQSRTIGTYGLETMTKLISFKVLIVGCGGAGVEVAKNLALAGIHTIMLYDPRRPTKADMGVNFAVTDEVIAGGKTVAEASRAYIQELNPNTRVRVTTELTEAVVAGMTAIIFTAATPDLSLKTLIRWNHFCRTRKPAPVSFLLLLQVGAVGSVFVDHGDNFVVKDLDGRPMLQKSITEVTERTDGTGERYSRLRFETPEGQTPGALRDYTQVQLSEVQGLTKADGASVNGELFDGVVCPPDPRDTVRIYPSFEQQGYTTAYQTGGFLHEQKETVNLSFRPLQECLSMPGEFIPVSPMMDGSEESQTHVLVHALLRFADKNNGFLPQLHSATDAQEVVRMAKAVVDENKAMPVPGAVDETPAQPTRAEFPMRSPPAPAPQPLIVDELNEDSIRTEALIAQVELQPLASFFGSVVAQEVVKISGKYTPIHQWFHISSEAVLPEKADYAGNKAEFAPADSRYDHQIAIFGKTFQNKLENLKVFMVGCGALGCENIKNFALCGIGCGKDGSLVVTDNDRIEVSNLSRQFLFREDNVGQPKSVAAGARMRQINPAAHVDARQDFVGPTTDHLYPDGFWEGLDVVVNALDNMEARLYVDGQCVRFHRILLEAGTMGTAGNVDIIVPGKTSSYSDGGGADQTGGIPMCTLRNFPYIYDHCIEWARSQFDDLFVSPMQSAHQIIEDPKGYIGRIAKEVAQASSDGEKRSLIAKHLVPLRSLKRMLDILAKGASMDECGQLAYDVVFRLFRDRILDLQACFPRDARKKNGEPFWSGHRKFPAALSAADAAAVMADADANNFLVAGVNLYACMFGIHSPKPEARFNDETHRWMGEYRSDEWLQSMLAKLTLPPYVPGAVDDLDDDAAADAAGNEEQRSVADEQAELDGLLREVGGLAEKCSATKAMPLEFEKDDDDNFQIDFVAAASNLRAENYNIPTADRMKVKLVAGKIIPAIATTTSAVTGLSLLELFKVLQDHDVSSLRNGMVDVGTNNYVLFERDTPIRHRTKTVKTYIPEQDYTYKKLVICCPEGFTKYDTVDIAVGPQTTVKEFATLLKARLNEIQTRKEGKDPYTFEIDGVGVGKGLLWNGRPSHANTNVPIMQAIEAQKVAEAGGSLPLPFWETRHKFFDLSVTVSCEDDDAECDEIDVEVPTICIVV